MPSDTHTWLDAIGIPDLTNWSPHTTWRNNDSIPTAQLLLGEPRDSGSAESMPAQLAIPTTAAIRLAVLGTGGAGKSYLLLQLVIASCARYSPDRINFMLAAAHPRGSEQSWGPLHRLPHVVDTAGGLHPAASVFERVAAEIQRRTELIADAKATSLTHYRHLQHADPGIPALPDLFLVYDALDHHLYEQGVPQELGDVITQLDHSSVGVHLVWSMERAPDRHFAHVLRRSTHRIAFQTATEEDSRMFLGSRSAYYLPRHHAIYRDQARSPGADSAFQPYAFPDEATFRNAREAIISRIETASTG